MSYKEIDTIFLSILKDQQSYTTNEAGKSTRKIFDVSAMYMDNNLFDVLKDFQALYLGDIEDEELRKKEKEANANVDNIMAMVQDNLAEGREADAGLDKTSDEAEKNRLGFAGLQKKLEALITIDDGIKNKIMPAISLMQFEDATTQRLAHIHEGFEIVTHGEDDHEEKKESLKKLEHLMSSVEETADFYETVLHETPPENENDASGEGLFF